MDKSAGASNSNNKRKICREEEEDEDEEAKMEAFFALVRNIRDTRDRWKSLRSQSDTKNNKRGKIIITANQQEDNNTVWTPTFQLEDFADDQAHLRNSGSSLTKTCAKENDAEKGIDLSLSL